ncbi:NADP-dependent malic enzyme [Candidatus Uabimicrobium sp. HlEnr_7]|uniref:NADP-dependent malic enzyme n=1 Tax=Candidatus Uabimicrobium helgolandensis TaxID=3095367 RepID=UPI003556DF10
MIKKEDALHYHKKGRKGKIEVTATKECLTQRDLSLAYSPGVAHPCLEIEKNPQDAYDYTAKGNLVGVISNGTAVLGLGNIGPLASKPVMEGKGVLFKKFADIDVFDIELNTQNADEFIRTVQLLEPTFGGINLEDIKAPECFYIEEQLQKTMNIPVFHDDQHGTAIISGAALINALDIIGKDIAKIKIVINGAGAAAIAGIRHYLDLGVTQENIIMCDRKGVIHKNREDELNPYKAMFAADTECRTLEDAMKGADVFLGYSVGGVVSKEMLCSMSNDPIVFALANPDPEISYEDAKSARDDVIMATGRSDYPNQVNNVLGFPFIFRGALDVQAKCINKEMKIAATHALVKLARQPVPESVAQAYGEEEFSFGRDYIIAKPFDPRVIVWEASAVAKAAMDTGVARVNIDIEEYKNQLEFRMGKSREIVRVMINKAKNSAKRIAYPEGENEKILRASNIVVEEGIAQPILIGNKEKILNKIKELNLSTEGIEIVDPHNFPRFEEYTNEYCRLRQRKGMTLLQAKELLTSPMRLAAMMVELDEADGMVAGINHSYIETIRPTVQILRTSPVAKTLAGMYMMIVNNNIKLFADVIVNVDTDPEILANIAILCAEQAKQFDIEPRIAMLSFSNFGNSKHPEALKMKEATRIVKQRAPHLEVDGEMSADVAINDQIRQQNYPFSTLKKSANILIFPELAAGNIAYKLLQAYGGAESLGPILLGMNKPLQLLQMGLSSVSDIVNMTAIAVVEAKLKAEAKENN